MTLVSNIQDWYVGEDRIFEFRIYSFEELELDADATTGATSLVVKPLKDALTNGDKIVFNKNTVLTLSAGAAAGAVAVSVSALPGPLRSGDAAHKIQNITGYTLEWELLDQRGNATAQISKATSGLGIVITSATEGLCQVTINRADTSSLTPKKYFHQLSRTDSGMHYVLSEGDAWLGAAGD